MLARHPSLHHKLLALAWVTDEIETGSVRCECITLDTKMILSVIMIMIIIIIIIFHHHLLNNNVRKNNTEHYTADDFLN